MLKMTPLCFTASLVPAIMWANSSTFAENGLPAPALKNVVPYAVESLPLSAVRLTGGPLKAAQDADARYLLQLEPDRMLYFLRKRAGLEPKAPKGYGGWDGDGRQLTGHIVGHYLSAISYMYAATGNPEFKTRADYIVSELKEIQARQGDGYLGALLGQANKSTPMVDGKTLFAQLGEGKIVSSGFDLNTMWSPWYVQHKIYAGLRDAYRLTGNKEALAVEVKFAQWADGILSRLSPDQIQKMLATEFGGMNEIMADLYADTGDQKWLHACDYFQHHAVIDALARRQDNLGGKHGNTQVPKMIGELERYIFTGQELSGNSATFFWQTVVDHHTFATGGHGYDEYFGAPDKLSGQVDGTGQRSKDLRTCETCNVYNMLKMTRKLFALQPDIHYADFLERALFNHILASIDPATGQTCYMVPVGQGVTHEYQDMNNGFTCCVGTGMESHALHGDGIFYQSADKLWINLYAPSKLHWAAGGVDLAMETDFPLGDSATITLPIIVNEREWTLSLRRPAWAGEGFAISVNGEVVKAIGKPDSYVELKRVWKSGDTIAIHLPKTLHTEPLPDNPDRVAFMWGPLVLGGDLGRPVRQTPATAPAAFGAFIHGDQPLEKWLKPVAGKEGAFHATSVANADITFVPFYTLAQKRYGIYWDVFTPAQWQKKGGQLTAEEEKRNALAAQTVAYVQPGEMQPERDFNFQGEGASVLRVREEDGRGSSGWFSFDLPVEPAKAMALVVTYDSAEAAKRTFDILIDGQKLVTETIERSEPARFYDIAYSIPAGLIKEKQKVTIRFQAGKGSETAGVFGLRMKRE